VIPRERFVEIGGLDRRDGRRPPWLERDGAESSRESSGITVSSSSSFVVARFVPSSVIVVVDGSVGGMVGQACGARRGHRGRAEGESVVSLLLVAEVHEISCTALSVGEGVCGAKGLDDGVPVPTSGRSLLAVLDSRWSGIRTAPWLLFAWLCSQRGPDDAVQSRRSLRTRQSTKSASRSSRAACVPSWCIHRLFSTLHRPALLARPVEGVSSCRWRRRFN
jgi:hypothetical protein